VQKCRIREYSWDANNGQWLDMITMTILDEEWDTQRGVRVSHRVEA
jgi:RimJ/RimL family protein N-acetyltransferase